MVRSPSPSYLTPSVPVPFPVPLLVELALPPYVVHFVMVSETPLCIPPSVRQVTPLGVVLILAVWFKSVGNPAIGFKSPPWGPSLPRSGTRPNYGNMPNSGVKDIPLPLLPAWHREIMTVTPTHLTLSFTLTCHHSQRCVCMCVCVCLCVFVCVCVCLCVRDFFLYFYSIQSAICFAPN